MLALLVLSMDALGTPRFTSTEPKASDLATAAWTAATECSGNEAAAAQVVPVVIETVAGVADGQAHFSGGPDPRLYSISVEEVDAYVIAHEVAHGWSFGGPRALNEGGADLLVACIARRRPDLFGLPHREGAEVEGMDLRIWQESDHDVRVLYTRSYNLFRVLSRAIPERLLWRRGWTWSEFGVVLGDAGAIGALVAAALEAGSEGQRSAFGDVDRDGLLGIEEQELGLDPNRWDSDGDGWWDGAPAGLRDAGVLLGADQRPVCAGWKGGPRGGIARVRGGVRRSEFPIPQIVAVGSPPVDERTMSIDPGVSLLLFSRTADSGWGIVEGDGLVPDDRCWSDERWTALVAPGYEPELGTFVKRVRAMDAEAEALLGKPSRRLLLALGTGAGGNQFTRVPLGWLDRPDQDFVAAYVVAAERLRAAPISQAGLGGPALFEALARKLSPSQGPLLAADSDDEVREWEVVVGGCVGGWSAFAAGRCP